MTTTADRRSREYALLAPLRSHFEQRGYDFFERPSGEVVPSFLGSYRPDAIAFDRAGGGVVIEIKSAPGPRSSQSLSEIAKRFHEHKDWTFQVLYEARDQDQEQEYRASGLEPIRAGLLELDSLSAGHLYRPAFLFAWSLLEAVGRELDPEKRQPVTARELIEWMTREGFIGQDTSRALRDLVPLRNAVAHGDLSQTVGPGEVLAVMTPVRDLVSTLEG